MLLIDVNPKTRLIRNSTGNLGQIDFAFFLKQTLQTLRDEKLNLADAKKRANELLSARVQVNLIV